MCEFLDTLLVSVIFPGFIFEYLGHLLVSQSASLSFGYRDFTDYLLQMLGLNLSANPTKWSNTLKQFVGNSQQVF